MRKLLQRLKTFSLFWEYLRAASQHWQEILGGTSLPLLIWTVWFVVGNPPTWINWTVVLLTVLIAGYFVWRADHIRLMPKLKISGTTFQDTPVTRSGVIDDRRTFVQLLPECLTESPVYECVAYLQRIERQIGENQWEEIALDKNLVLGWSEEKVELHPEAEKPLNVFFISHNTNQLIPSLKQDADIPWERFDALLMGEPILRFYVQITCSDRVNGNFVSLQPAKVCLEVRFEGPNRSRPVLELTQL
jgi:hypothetical protein